MFASAMEFFSQHIILANLTHVAGGFGETVKRIRMLRLPTWRCSDRSAP